MEGATSHHGRRHRRVTRPRVAAAMLAGALVLTLVLTAAGSLSAASRHVTISGFAAAPSPRTVDGGDTVTWTTQDGADRAATATGAFETGTIARGTSAAPDAASESQPLTDASPDGAPGAASGSRLAAWIILLAASLAVTATLLRPARRSRRRGRLG